jgi:glutaminase
MELDRALREIHREVTPHLGEGRVATYIPALARVDPRRFGMAVATIDGETHVVGEANASFSIQSISKVFTLTLALQQVGSRLWSRVGREPSGTPFNSLVQLEYERGVPRNPFINAGALVVTDVLLFCWGREEALGHILGLIREVAADGHVAVDPEVARSEKASGHRNVALANLIHSFGRFRSDVDEILDLYFHQCAIAMGCAQLARSALFLAAGGRDPGSGRRVISRRRARRINSLMLTCGHYDASGDFAFRVGLPGKSGVGGGILAVAPGRLAAAVWSPALNPQGSSLVGTLALEKLAAKTGLSVF